MNVYVLAPFITGILVLYLGFFVYLKNHSKALNKTFLLICLSSCAWLFSFSIGYGFDNPKISFLWLKIGYSGIVFIPITIFHYPVEFFKLKKLKPFVYLNYLIGLFYVILIWNSQALIEGIARFSWGYYPLAGPVHPIFLIHFLSLVGFSFAPWIYFFFFKRDKFTNVEIIRIKYVFGAYIIYNFASIDFLPNYKINVYPFGFLPSFVFFSIIGYTIVRYRIMDIKLIFKRSMAYSLSASLLMAVFVIIVLTITNLFSDYIKVNSLVVSIFAALVIAFLFNPLRIKIQGIVDKLFYKKTYDYYETIGKVTHELESMFELEKIYSYIGEVIYSTIGLKFIYALEADNNMVAYETVYYLSKKGRSKKENQRHELKSQKEGSRIKLSSQSELIRHLDKSGNVVIKDELLSAEMNLADDVIESIKKDFKLFGGEAAVPVNIDKKLALILILGEKLSGDLFSYEDINLLNIIGNQLAIAVKNATLYKEKLDSEKLASVGMMAATFAHEVRNPLTSLKTFAQLMPEKYNDEEFRDGFSRIVVGEIQKIDDLIKDLLDFSAEKKSSRVTEYDLVGIMNETIDYVSGKLGLSARNIRIEKKYSSDSVIMMGDVKQLRQLFTNLVTNGCQALNGEGTLKVEIRPDGESIDIAISDTGSGIHPDDIQKIFDPFVTNKEKGTGLGLSISKKIVEEHKGSLQVESRVSEGSTFTVTLPVQKG